MAQVPGGKVGERLYDRMKEAEMGIASRVRCRDCLFFRRGDDKGNGTCFRHPPVPLAPSMHGGASYRPQVREDEFCGDGVADPTSSGK